MSLAAEIEGARARIHGDFVERLGAAHVLMGGREAIANETSRWLEHLGAAADGDQAAAHELYKLVAFHARAIGADGHPASAALMQGLLFEDAVTAAGSPPGWPSPALRAILRELQRIFVDAHALGASERSKNRHHLEIRDFSPVVRLGERTIVGFLLGAMERDLIDAMVGRLLREVARTGAEHVILDVFGSARDNDTFHQTIRAFLRSEVGARLELTISGLRDPEATRAALVAVGCHLEHVHFEPDVNTALVSVVDGLRGAGK